MARIPDDVIERLKSDTDLVELVRRAGVELKKTGADLAGRCPLHDDETPSLVVSPSKRLWHCMGACQSGGSAIDWVMAVREVSFRHAVELLRAGEVPAGVSRAKTGSSVKHLAPPVSADGDDEAVKVQVAGYYHGTLTKEPVALSYLAGRRIDHPEAITTFKLGYANRTLGLRLPDVKGHDDLPIGGHDFSPGTVTRIPRGRPLRSPGRAMTVPRGV